jgi:hypothetical protein
MAITAVSGGFIDTSGSNPAGQSITLHASSQFFLVGGTGYSGSNLLMTSATLGGVAINLGDQINVADVDGAWFWYLKAPLTGSQTLDIAFDEAPVEGPICVWASFAGATSGIDLVGSIDIDADVTTTSSVTIASATGDLAVAMATAWQPAVNMNAGQAWSAISGTAQTFNAYAGQMFTKAASASSTVATNADTSYSSVALAILRESAGGATTSRKGGGAARKQMTRGPHLRMARKDRIYVPAYLAA